jgi:hypothetical protein
MTVLPMRDAMRGSLPGVEKTPRGMLAMEKSESAGQSTQEEVGGEEEEEEVVAWCREAVVCGAYIIARRLSERTAFKGKRQQRPPPACT